MTSKASKDFHQNKTPAKAFTPPAKRKWAQNQAGL